MLLKINGGNREMRVMFQVTDVFLYKILMLALASMTKLVAASSMNQRVADSIPSQGTYSDWGSIPPWSILQATKSNSLSH